MVKDFIKNKDLIDLKPNNNLELLVISVNYLLLLYLNMLILLFIMIVFTISLIIYYFYTNQSNQTNLYKTVAKILQTHDLELKNKKFTVDSIKIEDSKLIISMSVNGSINKSMMPFLKVINNNINWTNEKSFFIFFKELKNYIPNKTNKDIITNIQMNYNIAESIINIIDS